MVVLLGNQSVEFLTLLFWKSFLFLISLDLLTHYRIDVSNCDISCKYFIPVCHLPFYITWGYTVLAWYLEIKLYG